MLTSHFVKSTVLDVVHTSCSSCRPSWIFALPVCILLFFSLRRETTATATMATTPKQTPTPKRRRGKLCDDHSSSFPARSKPDICSPVTGCRELPSAIHVRNHDRLFAAALFSFSTSGLLTFVLMKGLLGSMHSGSCFRAQEVCFFPIGCIMLFQSEAPAVACPFELK